MLEAIESNTQYDKVSKDEINIGVDVLPRLPKDTTDRNRTSPFAFTGNKFELRMPGASASLAEPNIILNTILADELRDIADRLEKADDFTPALNALIRDTLREHKRILYGGNNYSDEWRKEAERRGLLNYPTTMDAVVHFCDEKNIALFARCGVFSEAEMHARQEIYIENYEKQIRIEALTMREMAGRDILPAVLRFADEIARGAKSKADIGIEPRAERKLLARLEDCAYRIETQLDRLNDALKELDMIELMTVKAAYCRDGILPAMEALRSAADEAELITDSGYWPYPTYGELLFSVK